MAVEAEELFIQPFRDIVERGQQAIENADDDDYAERAKKLAKAGQSIVKEGERALKKIQPLWDKQVSDHGDVFRDAIRKNDDLDERRRKLEDILYDFEDFIDADSFEIEKFTELQSAAKTFALDVIDTLKRMKLETSTPPPPRSLARRNTARSSRTGVPPLPPLPLPSAPPSRDLPKNHRIATASSRPSSRPGSRPSSPERPDSPTLSPLGPPKPIDGAPGLPNISRAYSVASSNGNSNGTTLDRSSTVTSKTSYLSSDLPPPPPRDVWAIPPPRTSSFGGASSTVDVDEKRQTQYSTRSSGAPSVIVSPTDAPPSPWMGGAAASTSTHPLQQYSIPEDISVDGTGYVNQISTQTSKVPIPSSSSATATTRSSPMFDSESPATRATSLFPSPETMSVGLARSSTSSAAPQALTRDQFPLPSHARLRDGGIFTPGDLERPSTSMTDYQDGLILADEAAREAEEQNLPPPALAREPDLNIGPKASIYFFKGFCEGAREVQKGPGTQGIKRTAGYGSGMAVGRCVKCEFSRELSEVQLDYAQDVCVNSKLSGVLFRPRFLWKSHISLSNTGGQMYGCLFCTAIGKVPSEGDATVFSNQSSLLRHMARHSQPLPHVPGVTVLYGKITKEHPQIEDYDIHFPDPPVACNTPDLAQLARLPIATAVKAHVARPGERKLVDPDGADCLKFYEGARIVGIEFPDRFGGKWAYGWHDGVRGAFAIKSVELDLPGRNEFPLQGGRGYTGAVRWKWDPKDKDNSGWLAVHQKEVITNIGWIHKNHWCWSGTNSKGKFGVFPSSHIDPITVKEELVSPISRTNSSLSGGGGGKKPRARFFGARRRVSSAASVSSASTDPRDVKEII